VAFIGLGADAGSGDEGAAAAETTSDEKTVAHRTADLNAFIIVSSLHTRADQAAVLKFGSAFSAAARAAVLVPKVTTRPFFFTGNQ
jgi:hypothetical protein